MKSILFVGALVLSQAAFANSNIKCTSLSSQTKQEQILAIDGTSDLAGYEVTIFSSSEEGEIGISAIDKATKKMIDVGSIKLKSKATVADATNLVMTLQDGEFETLTVIHCYTLKK